MNPDARNFSANHGKNKLENDDDNVFKKNNKIKKENKKFLFLEKNISS